MADFAGTYRIVNSNIPKEEISLNTAAALLFGGEMVPAMIRVEENQVTFYSSTRDVIKQAQVISQTKEGEIVNLTLSGKQTASLERLGKQTLRLSVADIEYTLIERTVSQG